MGALARFVPALNAALIRDHLVEGGKFMAVLI